MNEQNHQTERETFLEAAHKEAQRELHPRREDNSFWHGLSTTGVVGWSIVLPTLLGIAIGLWVDARATSEIAWVLIGLTGGLFLGIFNAWYWVSKERDEIAKQRERRTRDRE